MELFIELDSFQLYGIQSLTILKTMQKRKMLGTKLIMFLVGAFWVRLFCNFFNKGINTFLFSGFLIYQKLLNENS